MPRTKKFQSAHDGKVRQQAKQLSRTGHVVVADIPGHRQPKPIGKNRRIPDIVATKGGRKKVVEVETPKTLRAHRDQQSTFRRSAGQQPRTTFEIVVAEDG